MPLKRVPERRRPSAHQGYRRYTPPAAAWRRQSRPEVRFVTWTCVSSKTRDRPDAGRGVLVNRTRGSRRNQKVLTTTRSTAVGALRVVLRDSAASALLPRYF